MTDPERHLSLLTWARLNLALTAFVLSLLSAGGGALWQAGAWSADVHRRMDETDRSTVFSSVRAESLHVAIVDVDRRLNEITARQTETRQQIEREISDIGQRVSVLEAQMKFMGDRVQQNAGRR